MSTTVIKAEGLGKSYRISHQGRERYVALRDPAGYTGAIEVEIFNEDLWAMPGAEALSLCLDRFARHVT